jgi:four helix bundle protein
MRRAAVSVPSNIAEGNERESRVDHQRFITMARSSLAEIDTQLEISMRLGYTDAAARTPILALLDELGRGLYQLRRNLPR